MNRARWVGIALFLVGGALVATLAKSVTARTGTTQDEPSATPALPTPLPQLMVAPAPLPSSDPNTSSARTSALNFDFSTEARRMDELSANPAETERELTAYAETLRDGELTKFAELAADPARTHNERTLAVYLLSSVPQRACAALTSILERVGANEEIRFEAALDILVLRALEPSLVKDRDLQDSLRHVAERTSRPGLRSRLARSLHAAYEGRQFWTEKFRSLRIADSHNPKQKDTK